MRSRAGPQAYGRLSGQPDQRKAEAGETEGPAKFGAPDRRFAKSGGWLLKSQEAPYAFLPGGGGGSALANCCAIWNSPVRFIA
jgi:hypothetical protein